MNQSARTGCEKCRGQLFEMARNARLAGSERDLLQAHLGECAGCRNEFEAQVRLTRAMASLSAEAVLIPEVTEPGKALFEALNGVASERARPRRWWVAGGAIAAALLLSWGMW